MYRKYTGYVGKMQENIMRVQLAKKPDSIIIQAVKGMLPKNKLKNKIVQERLHIFPGPYHDLLPDKLPQFTTQDPVDINEEFEFGDKFFEKKNDYKIVYATHPDELPEELAGLEVDYDEKYDVPIAMEKK